MKTIRIVLGFLFVCLVPTCMSYADTIGDSFNDNSLNPFLWISSPGSGSINEINQRLEISLPLGNGELWFRPIISGDFKAQVDFTLLSRVSFVHLLFFKPSDILEVGRGDNVYFTNFGFQPPPYYTEYPGTFSDSTGTLRLTRQGDVYSGYFWDGTDWQLIHSASGGPTEDSNIVIGLHAGSSPSSVALDNFSVTADKISTVPEPVSLLLLGIGLVGLTAIRRGRVKKPNSGIQLSCPSPKLRPA